MAMNPMQRKIRNSFLFGFLVALIIGAVISGLLIMKNKQAQQEMQKLKDSIHEEMSTIYVTSKTVSTREALEEGVNIETKDIPTKYVPEGAITAANIDQYMNDDDTYSMVANVDMQPNTPLTLQTVEKSLESSTYRVVEFSMITLPSMLQEGDYIDIRLACLGFESIVLAKQQVISCNNTTIWLKLNESDLSTLNYAIIESYIIKGTKLYATQYLDAAQPALNVTYKPSDIVASFIKSNISRDGEEYDAFIARMENGASTEFRDKILRQFKDNNSDEYINDEMSSAISQGYDAEKANIQAARDALMGDMGY